MSTTPKRSRSTTARRDGFEPYPEDRVPPADPYEKLRNNPDLPPEVLAEWIAADDEYIAAYRKALREHFGLPPDDAT
jgi:NADPH-dependent ferric siderophore reductase